MPLTVDEQQIVSKINGGTSLKWFRGKASPEWPDGRAENRELVRSLVTRGIVKFVAQSVHAEVHTGGTQGVSYAMVTAAGVVELREASADKDASSRDDRSKSSSRAKAKVGQSAKHSRVSEPD